jgi:hypothetical protein
MDCGHAANESAAMPKFSALIAVVLAFLIVPALAAAAPTASHIATPASTAYVTFEKDNPGAFHVAGTTSGGTGAVDLRCYGGNGSPLIAGGVAVANGGFSVDIPVTEALMTTIGYPHPFCMLRAVPTGTNPAAAPDQPSEWEGVFVGLGYHSTYQVGSGYDPTPADTVYDYYVSRAQSGAMNDFDAAPSCGLCDTFLFVPGSQTVSNPIWYANGALDLYPHDVNDRTGVQIDGVNVYSGHSAFWNGGHHLANNAGFPALSMTTHVNQLNGDLTIDESAPYASCAEDRSVFPPTDASCASFTDSGVHYERSIETRDSGRMVTIVDHWKSVDGRSHALDALYSDTVESSNANVAGHQGIPNFTWTQDGFKDYPTDTQIPLPGSAPATMLVKTDASTSIGGDNMNPVGAMVFGSRPDALKLFYMGNGIDSEGHWQTRYQRTVPAGGEITIALGYVHDFALPSVQAKAQAATTALTPPTVHVASPLDGSTVDAPSVHVSGTASSADSEVSVYVNGTRVNVDLSGNWGTDVALNEGENRIMVSAQNDIGVVTNEIVHVTRPAAPAVAQTTTPEAPATTPIAVVAKPVRCVVPKLRGKSLAKAKRLLKHAHCKLGKVSRQANAKVKPGRVIKTRFKAGTRHRAGARVRVTLAKKPVA